MVLRRSIRSIEKTVPSRRDKARGTRCSWSLCTMWLEDRILLSAGSANPGATAPLRLPASVLDSAVPITIGVPASGNLGVGGADLYEITPGSNGRLIAATQAGAGSLE